MSFSAIPLAGSKPEQYAQLLEQARALLHGERDRIANAANLSALVYNALPDLNWVGFYFLDGSELVVGPFQGLPACVRIPLDKGVCGAAARTRQTQRIEDVHAFPGHIACDSASNSELVVPLVDADGARYPVQQTAEGAVAFLPALPAKGWRAYSVSNQPEPCAVCCTG